MQPFKRETGKLLSFREENLSILAIIPPAFLKQVSEQGYKEFIFFRYKYKPGLPRKLNPDFTLNQLESSQEAFLIVGENFAWTNPPMATEAEDDDEEVSSVPIVLGLLGSGIRAVIGPSFGADFKSEAQGRGLLVIELDQNILDNLETEAVARKIDIDLEKSKIYFEEQVIDFSIDEEARQTLLVGQDLIDYTLAYAERLEAYERQAPKF